MPVEGDKGGGSTARARASIALADQAHGRLLAAEDRRRRRWALVVWLVGAVAAWVCYRHQRQYALPWTWVWVPLMLLFGIPGLAGYWFSRRWPVREACPNCAAPAPRDRPSCFACGSDFPPTPAKGIEVFA